jgi:hypothetical protein
MPVRRVSGVAVIHRDSVLGVGEREDHVDVMRLPGASCGYARHVICFGAP